jgi:sensor histidine kinase regulating citrate/malate metabolism
MYTWFDQQILRANEGVLIVDNQKKVVILNRKFTEMWHLSGDLLTSRDEEQALAFVAQLFEDPQMFLNSIQELNQQKELEINDTITFKDGRVLKRCSRPLWRSEEYVGRLWLCRETSNVNLSQEPKTIGQMFELSKMY